MFEEQMNHSLCCQHMKRIISDCTHHFIKNINSPLLSVAPMIRSGSRFLAKPRGFSG